jgi:beta-phosphoglucomutase-like phosphatase (HAD superfamily)
MAHPGLVWPVPAGTPITNQPAKLPIDKIRGLLFDFDGLLVDTEAGAYRSWCEIYEEHGQELLVSDWLANVGTLDERFDPIQQLESLTGQTLDREALLARYLERELELSNAEELREGVQDYLVDAERLGLEVAIVSSAGHTWVLSHVRRLGVEHVWHSITCANGDAGRAKPAPDLYLEALEGLRLGPDEAIAFEDSLHGVQAAKAAGLFCVAVPNPVTASLALDEADLVLQSLADLPLDELLHTIER